MSFDRINSVSSALDTLDVTRKLLSDASYSSEGNSRKQSPDYTVVAALGGGTLMTGYSYGSKLWARHTLAPAKSELLGRWRDEFTNAGLPLPRPKALADAIELGKAKNVMTESATRSGLAEATKWFEDQTKTKLSMNFAREAEKISFKGAHLWKGVGLFAAGAFTALQIYGTYRGITEHAPKEQIRQVDI